VFVVQVAEESRSDGLLGDGQWEESAGTWAQVAFGSRPVKPEHSGRANGLSGAVPNRPR
jgi:hypothetical protein